MPNPVPPLTDALRKARRARRLSQLQLALHLGVSQRHVSFVESGRSRPSRELLIAWMQALDAPLALSNEALHLAGYAPAYSSAPLDDPYLGAASHALQQLLAAHEPAPALVLDVDWNALRLNGGARWLATTLLPEFAAALGASPINMLDLLTHEAGLSRSITNLDEVGPRFLAMLRHEAAAHAPLEPRVAAYEAMLRAKLGERATQRSWSRAEAPVLTSRFSSPHGELAFFSMFTTFGTPRDITLASLRVEHLFPADEATRAVLRKHVALDDTG